MSPRRRLPSLLVAAAMEEANLPAQPSTQNRGPQLEAVAVSFLVVTVISYALRTYVRVFMTRSFGVDDWLMTAATTSFILYVTCVLGGVRYGTGRHAYDLSPEDRSSAMEFWFFCYLGYCWTMIFSKISIGLFLLRILVQKSSRRLVFLAMGLSVVTGLIFFFVAMLQCSPIPYFWDKATDGSCISIEVIIDLTFLYSALNIVCDFTFALMPIFIVRNLNMPRRLKMATIPLLSLGCVASSGAVVRMAYVETFRDPDFLYSTVDIAIWATVEAGLAITAGSLACVRPLFKLAMHSLGFTSSKDLYPVGSSNTDALRLGSQRRPYPSSGSLSSKNRPGAGSRGGGGGGSRTIDVFTLHTIHSSPADEDDQESDSLHHYAGRSSYDSGSGSGSGGGGSSPVTKLEAVASTEETRIYTPHNHSNHAMGFETHRWGTKTHIYAREPKPTLGHHHHKNGGWPSARDHSPS